MTATVVRCMVIEGRVQGVGFRYTLAEEARALGLRGWVRNRRDGTVEAIVAGPAEAVDAIIAWAHKGPSSARVSAVSVALAAGEFAEFEIAPTI
jgi:acylphosphatase